MNCFGGGGKKGDMNRSKNIKGWRESKFIKGEEAVGRSGCYALHENDTWER